MKIVITKEDGAEILRLYGTGIGIEPVSDKTGKSRWIVTRVLREHDAVRKRPKNSTKHVGHPRMAPFTPEGIACSISHGIEKHAKTAVDWITRLEDKTPITEEEMLSIREFAWNVMRKNHHIVDWRERQSWDPDSVYFHFEFPGCLDWINDDDPQSRKTAIDALEAFAKELLGRATDIDDPFLSPEFIRNFMKEPEELP